MKTILMKWGNHLIAILIFLALTVAYFSPAILDGKTIRQGDMEKAAGMGGSQMEQYEATAQPGEFSAWSDAMFGGLPYAGGYGNPAPNLPSYELVEAPLKGLGYFHAGMVFTGLVCFYLLMCVMGMSTWLAIAGAIAFALASYNIIIIEAGHITKAYVIAYMPITLAGMALLFKQKRLWGAVLFLLGVALSIGNGHIQITYYLMLLCYGSRDVILTGDSAGGNLALALTLKLKQEGRLLPRGLILMSPWTDLTSSGQSFESKAELDPVLNKAYIDRMVEAYAGGQELKNPLISPLFGNFDGFPPTYIQVGENEILLSDSERLHQAFADANVSVRMDTYPGMWHVFQMSPVKAARDAMDKNAEFIYDICR